MDTIHFSKMKAEETSNADMVSVIEFVGGGTECRQAAGRIK